MSRLKSKLEKIAVEFERTDDGKYVNLETGEITDYEPKDEPEGVQFKEEVRRASDDYLSPDYYNGWGKVSPFNIIMKDNMNSLYSLKPQEAADAVINIIEQLNTTYANDKTYDYVSKEYLNKLKMNLQKQRSIDGVLKYLTNIYFRGLESKQKYASLNVFDTITLYLDNKNLLSKYLIGLNVLNKLK